MLSRLNSCRINSSSLPRCWWHGLPRVPPGTYRVQVGRGLGGPHHLESNARICGHGLIIT
jgi:hypothetical protein